MPKILAWLTRIGFWLALFLPASLIPLPGDVYGIGTQQMSFTEFWKRGGGPTFFLAGILFPLTGYGFLRARNWSRYLFVGMHIALTISFFVTSGLWAVAGAVWTTFMIWYLFFFEDVRQYFDIAVRDRHLTKR